MSEFWMRVLFGARLQYLGQACAGVPHLPAVQANNLQDSYKLTAACVRRVRIALPHAHHVLPMRTRPSALCHLHGTLRATLFSPDHLSHARAAKSMQALRSRASHSSHPGRQVTSALTCTAPLLRHRQQVASAHGRMAAGRRTHARRPGSPSRQAAPRALHAAVRVDELLQRGAAAGTAVRLQVFPDRVFNAGVVCIVRWRHCHHRRAGGNLRIIQQTTDLLRGLVIWWERRTQV
mmetsp:Transcript_13486/g.39077  ORF Transcript_13486/g.39077 Transcript_13486/m.39077 type:complete len:235 (+) Transcript_13486:397-1101(+)